MHGIGLPCLSSSSDVKLDRLSSLFFAGICYALDDAAFFSGDLAAKDYSFWTYQSHRLRCPSIFLRCKAWRRIQACSLEPCRSRPKFRLSKTFLTLRFASLRFFHSTPINFEMSVSWSSTHVNLKCLTYLDVHCVGLVFCSCWRAYRQSGVSWARFRVRPWQAVFASCLLRLLRPLH